MTTLQNWTLNSQKSLFLFMPAYNTILKGSIIRPLFFIPKTEEEKIYIERASRIWTFVPLSPYWQTRRMIQIFKRANQRVENRNFKFLPDIFPVSNHKTGSPPDSVYFTSFFFFFFSRDFISAFPSICLRMLVQSRDNGTRGVLKKGAWIQKWLNNVQRMISYRMYEIWGRNICANH